MSFDCVNMNLNNEAGKKKQKNKKTKKKRQVSMDRLLRPSLFHLHVKLTLLHFKNIDTHICNIFRMYPFMIRL